MHGQAAGFWGYGRLGPAANFISPKAAVHPESLRPPAFADRKRPRQLRSATGERPARHLRGLASVKRGGVVHGRPAPPLKFARELALIEPCLS
jgi:hypothetical protein